MAPRPMPNQLISFSAMNANMVQNIFLRYRHDVCVFRYDVLWFFWFSSECSSQMLQSFHHSFTSERRNFFFKENYIKSLLWHLRARTQSLVRHTHNCRHVHFAIAWWIRCTIEFSAKNPNATMCRSIEIDKALPIKKAPTNFGHT